MVGIIGTADTECHHFLEIHFLGKSIKKQTEKGHFAVED